MDFVDFVAAVKKLVGRDKTKNTADCCIFEAKQSNVAFFSIWIFGVETIQGRKLLKDGWGNTKKMAAAYFTF